MHVQVKEKSLIWVAFSTQVPGRPPLSTSPLGKGAHLPLTRSLPGGGGACFGTLQEDIISYLLIAVEIVIKALRGLY